MHDGWHDDTAFPVRRESGCPRMIRHAVDLLSYLTREDKHAKGANNNVAVSSCYAALC